MFVMALLFCSEVSYYLEKVCDATCGITLLLSDLAWNLQERSSIEHSSSQ